ncbi:CRISPR-associated endonuclease Cas3'' [Haloarcula sp. JP-L23]|uniref:CRISPR-associated endonuclease Cas3'' n=1 Tax=Haloarcula sp. JP-L23 TaxID=2716717 RepID=UPI00140ECCAD|nr:CRISPR-associated endonuclease Cas3'' [Haloarcula sp. JP-L23]
MFERTDRYSHYRHNGEPIHLLDHQRDVAERVTYLAPMAARSCAGIPVSELVRPAALVHDFGKLTTAFQRHLDGESVDEPKSHAPLASFAAFYALDEIGYDRVDALVGLVAVAKHHGDLPDIADYVFENTHPEQQRGRKRIERIRSQIEDIDDNAAALADEILSEATDGAGSWDEFANHVAGEQFLLNVLGPVTGRTPMNSQPDALPEDFYDAVLSVWSTLTLADKTSAAALTAGATLDTAAYDGDRPSLSSLEDKIATLKDSLDSDATADERRIHELRGDAHEEVMDAVGEFRDANASVASITLPTGLGKTLTGINAGLELLARDETDEGRLIYALPFTSIIDQVATECREVFDTNGHDKILTVDHHLAETVIDRAEFGESDPDTVAHIEALLGESWRSGMVVTTFVQLFESLAGPSNGQSTKLSALDGNVVILDEPQALPEAWWPLARRLVTLLEDQYSVRTIVMTATQPKVFEQDGRTTYELVERPDRYYEALDRVVFELDESAASFVNDEPTPLGYETAAATLLSKTDSDESALAICNTIDSARELTDALIAKQEFTSLNDVYDEVLAGCGTLTSAVEPAAVVAAVRSARDGTDPVLLHLTTRHRPVDRQLLLDVTKELHAVGIPVVAVTTQLVEAGVDISFNRVYRDFAPMSSIVQAAGRCNRSFERDCGKVTVWLLESPGDLQQLPSTAVYGGDGAESRPKLTAQAIAAHRSDGQSQFSETSMSWNVVTDYFKRLQDRNPGNREYVEYVTDAKGDELGHLSLIQSGNAVDIVVARTGPEEELLGEIEEAFDGYQFDQLDETLADTRELQVSIPLYDETSEEARRISDLNPVHAGATLRQVKARTDSYDAFSALAGLSVPSSSVDNRFL